MSTATKKTVLSNDARDKLAFMDQHGIDVSVVSIHNTTFDQTCLSAEQIVKLVRQINDELAAFCRGAESHEASKLNSHRDEPHSNGTQPQRLFAFGTLPLAQNVEQTQVLQVIEQIQQAPSLKGVMIGTSGLGSGLAHEALEPVWEALAASGLVAFVHPQGDQHSLCCRDVRYSSVLSSALGEPFEVTVAVSELILSGVLDRHPDLKLLLSHSGGSVSTLSSYLSACVQRDVKVRDELKNDVRYYLSQMWFDTLGTTGTDELTLVERTIARAEKYEGKDEELEFVDRVTRRSDLIESTTGSFPGTDRILFGTDHPLSFRPFEPGEDDVVGKWRAVNDTLEVVQTVEGWNEAEREKVLGQNAVELFDLWA
ncbi:hypothetical protein OIO90_003385 [Microbotryomycetes sp. JL221]|nr:hypothetical protein OIO90_003385 [Microbotryomycetes sp. JL221]